MNRFVRAARRQIERAKYDYCYYDDEYWKEDLPGKSGNRGLSYDDPEHRDRFEFLAKVVLANVKFKSFLDAGCGTGMVADTVARAGARSLGIDFSLSGIARCNWAASVTWVNAAIEDLPFRSDTFDLVWCSDVMEHLPGFDVDRAARELIRVAKDRVVLTINLDNPYYYHPSILPREEWVEHFTRCGRFAADSGMTEHLERCITRCYPEYSLFAFHRVG